MSWLNGGSSTPTTVSGVPLTVSVAPIADGSLLKRRFHVLREITTTGLPVPGALSSSVNRRPRSARSPSTSKNEPVANVPTSRCGSSVPVMFTLCGSQNAIDANVPVCFRISSYSA